MQNYSKELSFAIYCSTLLNKAEDGSNMTELNIMQHYSNFSTLFDLSQQGSSKLNMHLNGALLTRPRWTWLGGPEQSCIRLQAAALTWKFFPGDGATRYSTPGSGYILNLAIYTAATPNRFRHLW
jgi:hypothetical protein